MLYICKSKDCFSSYIFFHIPYSFYFFNCICKVNFVHIQPDAALQEGTTSLSQVSLVIDSLKNEQDAERCAYIKKRMEENRMKLAGITKKNHMLAEERKNLGIINGGKVDNLLTKRQKDAIHMQNGNHISSSQDNGHASVILLGYGIPVKSCVPPIKLPKVEKLPPYTTWIFLDRNQTMTEDQSVVGRRRIYYDDGGEALICSDSEEENIDDNDKKKEFFESEDNIIWCLQYYCVFWCCNNSRSTIKQTGSSDIVYELLAKRLSRTPCEIKERYESLKCSKTTDADFNPNSFFDQDLEEAQDSLDKLFCRRCLIFDCKLHGCSQELIFPVSSMQSMNDENVPCGPHCYLQLNTEQTITVSSAAASGVPVTKEKSSGVFLRKRLKTSQNAQKDSASFDSEAIPVHDVNMNTTNRSPPSPNKTKRARTSITSGSKDSNEFSSSSTKEKFLSTTQPRKKDTFVPTGNALSRNNAKKKNLSVYGHTSRKVTDFESWRTLEKCLIKQGVQIYGRNSCLIARNIMLGEKTCAEVYHVLQYHLNELYSRGSNSISSQDDDRAESNENMGTARRRRSNFFHRRGRFRRLKYTWKSAGSRIMRKRNSDKKDTHCVQYNPCGCQSVCGGDCSCLASGTCCEKFCGCPKTCKNRFRGCHCAKSQCRSRQCPCFAANRECDPDLCQHCWISCGDGTLGSPGKKGNSYECQNVKLLLKQKQRILLGRSEVSGWGAFSKDSVPKDGYLGEYTGELISHYEADKRGKIYDRENCSFLFNLNDQYVLDAYRKGDKLKFANHSPDPNCYAKVMMVAGDHRVGIFAKESISAGEELFYDYRYEPDKAPSWAKKPEDCGSRREDPGSSSGRAKKIA
ncbi:putative [histone H3]-lysine(4) N-trimethyltransferase chromatin remodeling SET family [Helianthus annuus]|nr:putative [histone H3]-lysine(4) N-trimethyltransferase chromatin remodeling SET family [Helianthus annuus]KAJ0486263.1 putative [histone H3]-lysine(4) N-trimethyltransferase chromatin remodeling SET family [Helianthus annuus]KAJ0656815.1 putative [histone H3]-lysine(4) N-trimethyltransferase chromatin remodeling SET family [Helianthus annuus]KAJ0660411.1 putative [histone H3]-lysine(4) N-trimethyltransferase chromatin remodeling SET family [Helianthus annuus]